MMNPLTQPLSSKVQQVWFLRIVLNFLVAACLGLLAFLLSRFFHFSPTWLPLTLIAYAAAVALITLIQLALVPYRYRFHRFALSADQLDIQTGAFFRKIDLIPLKKVQHLEVSQGPLFRQAKLSELTLYTAASVHKLSGLDIQQTDLLREQLLKLVKEAKDED